jgi:LCP family protein required for cell wall assembly
MYDGLRNLDVPRRKKSGAKRALKISGVGLLVFTLGLCSFGAYVWVSVNKKIKDSQVPVTVHPVVPGEPQNILIVGSDQRSAVSGKLRSLRQFRKGTGARTDTIMLLHVAAKAKGGVLVSFPRDLYVHIPGHETTRINKAFTDAYKDGGRDLLIKTVEKLSGLQINHYVEINFESFLNIVDSVGGVSIYFPEPLHDDQSGLDINKAGCVHLDGNQALSFVRARHIYASADLGRIQAQQRFIRAIVAKARGAMFNPTKVLAVSNAITKGLAIDKKLDLSHALGIAQKLSDQSRLDFRIFPGSTRSGSPYVFPNYSQAREFFTAMAADQPLPAYGKTGSSLPEWTDIAMKVLNGSGRTGWAGTQKTKLKKLGARVSVIGTADAETSQTTIAYAPGEQLKADLVKKEYPYARIVAGGGNQNQDVVLTLGSDSLPATSSPGPKPTQTKKSKPVTPAKPAFGQACG